MKEITPIQFKQMDVGRQADVARLMAKRLNPDGVQNADKIDDALRAIKQQDEFKSIKAERERLRIATLNGDKARADQIAERMKKTMDGDWSSHR